MDFNSHDFEIKHRQYLSQLPADKQTVHTRQMAEHFKLMDDINALHLQYFQEKTFPEHLVPSYHAKLCKAYYLSQTMMGDLVYGTLIPAALEPFVGPFDGRGFRIMPSHEQFQMPDLFLGHPATMLKAMAFGISAVGSPSTSTPAMNALSTCILTLEPNEEAKEELDLHLRTVLQQADFGVKEFMWCLYILHSELVRSYRTDVGTEEIKQRHVYERVNRQMDKAIQLQPQALFAYWAAGRHAIASQDMPIAHEKAKKGLKLAQELGDGFHTCLLANLLGYTIACGSEPVYTLGQVRGLFKLADSCYKDTKRYMQKHDFDAALSFRSFVDQALEHQDPSISDSVPLTEPLLLKSGGTMTVEEKHGKYNCDMCKVYGMLKKCSKCKTAAYCSRSCQVAHWKEHKLVCKTAAAAKGADTAPKQASAPVPL